jgi:Mg2+-importing ATPase
MIESGPDHAPPKYRGKVAEYLIRDYMIIFGLTSSVFDMATFYLLFKAFPVTMAQFRTGWFMESLATQILVVYIIRTSESPFWKSKPGKWLVVSTLSCLVLGWSLPYMPFAKAIGFEPLPLNILVMIIGLVIVYLVAAELMKRFVLKRFIPEAWG